MAGEESLAGVRAELLGPEVVAANLTMPHKQRAARTADSATEPVRVSGAANLLIRQGGELIAHNTDVTAAGGFLANRVSAPCADTRAGGPSGLPLSRSMGRPAGSPWPTGMHMHQTSY